MTLRRFYFVIREANVYECIRAQSFTEAKQIAAAEWLPFWDKIEWINTEGDQHEGITELSTRPDRLPDGP